MPLTDTQLRNFKPKEKTYKVADGSGLYVQVTKSGSKLWRMAYRLDGKRKLQKLIVLGKYPDVSLSKAREKHRAACTLVADGIDPVAKAKAEKADLLSLTDPTYALRGALIVKAIQPMAAITTWREFKGLVLDCWNYASGATSTQTALKLMVLFFPRPGELRRATWDEFDFDNLVWRRPADHMKGKLEERTPHPKPIT